MGKKKNRIDGKPLRKKRNFKRNFKIIVLVVLIAGCGFTAYKIATGIKSIETDNISISTETETETETLPFQVVYEQVDNSQIYNGDLILVNNNTEYKAQGSEELVSIFDEKTSLHSDSEDGDTAFGVTNSSLELRKNAADQLIAMLDAFNSATGIDDVVVCSGYRTNEDQQSLYDEDLENTGLDYSTRVALPGYSEHESGYSIDLSLADGEYDGTGNYSWINEHCGEYGFILRYPENKMDITQIEYESWHYRYIGIPHAEYVTESGICFEEYIDMLKSCYEVSEDNYSVLEYTAKDGKIYDIYYVKADDSAESTYVPLPADTEYEISGNNIDGFVIWFDTGRTGVHKDATAPVTETTESESSDSTDTSTDTSLETSSESAE